MIHSEPQAGIVLYLHDYYLKAFTSPSSQVASPLPSVRGVYAPPDSFALTSRHCRGLISYPSRVCRASYDSPSLAVNSRPGVIQLRPSDFPISPMDINRLLAFPNTGPQATLHSSRESQFLTSPSSSSSSAGASQMGYASADSASLYERSLSSSPSEASLGDYPSDGAQTVSVPDASLVWSPFLIRPSLFPNLRFDACVPLYFPFCFPFPPSFHVQISQKPRLHHPLTSGPGQAILFHIHATVATKYSERCALH